MTSIATVGKGTVMMLQFDGILVFTHHATDLFLPNGGNDITTAAGDHAIMEEYDTGKWRCVVYQRADGSPLATTLAGMTLTSPVLNAPDINGGTIDAITSLTVANNVDIGAHTFGCEGIQTDGTNTLITKVIDIGDWNMDSTAQKTVTHGVTLANVRKIEGVIRSDSGLSLAPITPAFAALGTLDCIIRTMDGTDITLERMNAGNFDNANYDDTPYNRGWLIVTYVP